MSHDPAFDASIPVLTEIVAEPIVPDVPVTPPAPVTDAAPHDAPEALEQRAVDHWSGE